LSDLQKADQHDDAILGHLTNDAMPALIDRLSARSADVPEQIDQEVNQ